MNKLVVLTDLGTFKAFRQERDLVPSTPRLQVLDSYENVEGDDRIGRRLSDQAGNFQKNGAQSFAALTDGETGERHNGWFENEKRSVPKIADKISELLANGEFDSCSFAASNESNRQIVVSLAPAVRRTIEKNLHCNLVNAPNDEVLEQFK